jgi:hypothetical protein
VKKEPEAKNPMSDGKKEAEGKFRDALLADMIR